MAALSTYFIYLFIFFTKLSCLAFYQGTALARHLHILNILCTLNHVLSRFLELGKKHARCETLNINCLHSKHAQKFNMKISLAS